MQTYIILLVIAVLAALVFWQIAEADSFVNRIRKKNS
jgi:hypothetical protein